MKSAKNIIFRPKAQKAFDYWAKTQPSLARKILQLIEEIKVTPFYGLGKPEALKHDLSGCWSRRLDDEHRLVHRVEEDAIIILSCRFHYQ